MMEFERPTIYDSHDSGPQDNNAVLIHRCRYCDGHPVMDRLADGVYECPECAYEETVI